jgi:hypothetical protein
MQDHPYEAMSPQSRFAITPPVRSRLDKYNNLHYSCSDIQYLQQGSQ